MAPALTSEVPQRVREKHPRDQLTPNSQHNIVGGSDLEQNLVGQSQKCITLPTSIKGLHTKKAVSGPVSVINPQPTNKLLQLGAVPNLAEIFKQDSLLVKPGATFASSSCQPASGEKSSGMSQTSSSGLDQTGKCTLNPGSNSHNQEPAGMVPPLNNASQHSNHNNSRTSLGSVGLLNSSRPSTDSLVNVTITCGSMGLVTQSSIVASTALKTCVTNGVNSLARPLTNFIVSTSVAANTSASTTVSTAMTSSTSDLCHRSTPIHMDKRVVSNPVISIGEMSAEASRKQKMLETRAERVLKRLRRLQSRQSISHVKQQMCGFVENQQQTFIASRNAKAATSDEFKAELLQSKDVKNLSTAALVNLVQKLQASQPSGQRSRLNSSPASETDSDGKIHLEEEMCLDIDRVTGHLQSNLRHLQSTVDSDATESSSGGESCDDMDMYEEEWDGKAAKPLITRRAEWQWCQNRAAIAARWTWLQAQVSDLEYRIRQQNDIYRQIRNSKGEVVLGDPAPVKELFTLKVSGNPLSSSTMQKPQMCDGVPVSSEKGGVEMSPVTISKGGVEMSPANISTLLSNIDKQSSHLTQQLGNVYSPQTLSPAVSATNSTLDSNKSLSTHSTPNGYVDSSHPTKQSMSNSSPAESTNKPHPHPSHIAAFEPLSPAIDSSCRAARCRPVRTYRKRKLLKTAGLYQLSRKAAKLSTVKCHCFPPVIPCAMCGGRLNNVNRLDCVTMSQQERIALLDSAYHPVLSFPYDVPLSVHFESLLKSGEWQQKPPPKGHRIIPNDKRRAKYNKERVRKYTKRLSKSSSAVFLSSAKIRSKYEQKQLSRSQSSASLSCGGSVIGGSPLSVGGDVLSRLPGDSSLQRKRKSMGVDALHRRRSLPTPSQRSRSISTSMLMQSSTPSRRDSQSPLNTSSHTGTLKDGLKKKRAESAYDINNIVIPYSIASSVRVEKLQYKEIVTPKWRELTNGEDSCSSPLPGTTDEVTTEDNNQDVKENGMLTDAIDVMADTETKEDLTTKAESVETVDVVAKTDDGLIDEGDLEDLTDDVFVTRHLKCEIAEKKRFSTIPSTTNRRGRANVHKSESSANLSLMATGCDPDSPEVMTSQTETLHQLVASPATPTIMPGTFAASLDEAIEESSRKSKHEESSLRKRTASMSSRLGVRSRSVSHSEDLIGRSYKQLVTVTPWAARTFPLSEDDLLDLTRTETVASVRRRCVFETDTPSSSGTPIMTPSHSNAASDVEEPMDEDPDDPEWTVISEHKPVAQTAIPKTSIVLKLAKR